MRKISKMDNPVAKNAGWIIGGKIMQMAINGLVGLTTARYLGPSHYGLMGYAGAYTSFFASICNLGINSVIVKALIDHPEQEGMILGSTLGMRAVSSTLSALTIIGISLVVDAGETTTQMVVAFHALSVVLQIFEVFRYWFQAKLQSRITAMVTLAACALTSVYKIILLVRGAPVTCFALAVSLEHCCAGLFFLACYRKNKGKSLAFSRAWGISLLRKSGHFILPGLVSAIYAQTDKFMLKRMISDAQIGYYSTAISLCGAWCFVLSAIIDSFYPPIMESFRRSKEEFDKKNKQLYAIIIYVSAGVSLLFTVFGEDIIRVLYGEAYLPAAAPLRVLTWYTAFSYLGVARNAWVVCMNRQKRLKYIYTAAAVSNVILNFVFIPRWGAAGAAAASLVTQMVTIIAPLFIRDMRENTVMMWKAMLFR